jgi:peptidoglycan/xylan/chitin deacetylase (PgdA/CDA1 family)
VILCHDEMFRKSWEESELKQLIDKLRTKGFKFGHLSEYP